MTAEDIRFRLPKWPFLVADGLLILAAAYVALALDVSDGWKGFWVFLLVGLAFICLAFPFVAELSMNIRLAKAENEKFRRAMQRKSENLETDLLKAAEALARLAERTEHVSGQLAEQTGTLQNRIEALEESQAALEAHFKERGEASTGAEAELTSMREELDGLQAEHARELQSLKARMDNLGDGLETLREEQAKAPAPKEEAPEIHEAPEPDEVENAQEPILEESAVSEDVEDVEDSPDFPPEEPDFEEADETEDLDAPEPEPEPEKPASPPPPKAAEPAPSDEEASEADWDAFAMGDVESEPDEAAPPASLPKQADLLGDVPQARRKAPKAPRKATALIANMLIGIGNTPYIRGEGGGLSMDHGEPMQFLEIGKWQWVARGADKPVKVIVYKNDEVAANEGEILLEPGERKEVNIRFPSS